jgi:hypothetical protein
LALGIADDEGVTAFADVVVVVDVAVVEVGVWPVVFSFAHAVSIKAIAVAASSATQRSEPIHVLTTAVTAMTSSYSGVQMSCRWAADRIQISPSRTA